MLRGSNAVIGAINFLTFLISIPILGGGIWLSARAHTECLRFLQWPLIIIGLAVMAVSLAGFAGACYRLTWLLRLYLLAMFLLILALLVFVVFAFAATDRGSGRRVPGGSGSFLEYRLGDYKGWLKDRVADPGYWDKISSCLKGAKVCGKMGRYVTYPAAAGVVQPETADMFYQRSLSPVESGCCKPPTACGFTYMNETFWSPGAAGLTAAGDDEDCARWSNDQELLCYGCDSCKAGVLATLKKSWRKVSVLNIVVLVVLVLVYAVAVGAFRNNRRRDNSEPYGEARMTKAQPSRFQF